MSAVFDYVIIGAGSSGCVLANRLTENRDVSVLLLEAGPEDRNPWIHIPMGYGKLFADERTNWMYESDSEQFLDGRRVFTPRGKVLGGSSSINGLVHIRGQREDFDSWEKLGNSGWGFEDVLPYFKKSESHYLGNNEYHGSSGPLRVSQLPTKHPLADAFINGLKELGIPENNDFNGVSQEGVGYYDASAHKGRRQSTAVAYLKPIRHRSNLVVMTRCEATKILFKERKAVGIRVRHQEGEQEFSCRRELILSAGSINSPKLLQLSGVGSSDLLRKYHIPIVADLPAVGEGLQDHFYVRTQWRCNRPITFNDRLGTPLSKLITGLEYCFLRKGPLTVSAGYAGAFLKSRPGILTPDLQFYFINFSTNKMGSGLHRFPAFTISVSPLRPNSRGSVQIQSGDPVMSPSIRYNFLSDVEDQRVVSSGLRWIEKFVASPSLSDYVAGRYAPENEFVGDEECIAFSKSVGGTVYHPTSTCAMGVEGKSVVDSELRVHGLEGIRVIDASIMPSVISGNTNAATVMIAEKGADLIKSGWCSPLAST